MTAFILRRLAYSVLVLWGVSVIAFALIHLIPGDPARLILGMHATPQALTLLRHTLGLDKPLLVQYWTFISNAVHGNLGVSLASNQPVAKLIAQRFPATAELAFSGMLLGILFGIVGGVLAARFKGTWMDSGVTTVSVLGMSVPTFWVGMLLIMVFSVHLAWLPVAGGIGIPSLVMPAVTLGLVTSSVTSRLARSGMVEALSAEYVRTARAKGIKEWRILFKHALRNSLIPLVTVFGLQLASLLGGTVIIESVFDWPGMGLLAIQSIEARDYPTVQGVILVLGVFYVVINLLVDVLYGVIDPRIDLKAGGSE